MYEHIQVSEGDGITTITLCRPERLNTFIGHMRRDLAEALEHAGSDRNTRVVILTGAGRAFCAGGDIAFMAELMQRRDSEEFSRILGAGRRVILAIRQMTKPVIAAVNGPASGAGCNLALACDLRVASNTATFSQSFAKLGLHPDWGGTYFLPRLVTPNKACELFFLGEAIDAEEALRLEIVNQVVAPEDLESDTATCRTPTRRAADRLSCRKARGLHEPGGRARRDAALRNRSAVTLLRFRRRSRRHSRVSRKTRTEIHRPLIC